MKLTLGFHSHLVAKKVIEKELDSLGIPFKFRNSSRLEFLGEVSDETLTELRTNLSEYGIELKKSEQHELIQKIKDTVTELIYSDAYYTFTASTVISNKLNLSYRHISNLFSEHTLNTLENYIILQRIERAKLLILSSEYTLTEIAHKLNYSSVGHLSNQFKKITGLTSTSFIRIIQERNNHLKTNNQIDRGDGSYETYRYPAC